MMLTSHLLTHTGVLSYFIIPCLGRRIVYILAGLTGKFWPCVRVSQLFLQFWLWQCVCVTGLSLISELLVLDERSLIKQSGGKRE